MKIKIRRRRRSSQQRRSIAAPGQQGGVFVLDGEDAFSQLQDELAVVALDGVHGQRDGEVWELEHLHWFRSRPQRLRGRKEEEEERC